MAAEIARCGLSSPGGTQDRGTVPGGTTLSQAPHIPTNALPFHPYGLSRLASYQSASGITWVLSDQMAPQTLWQCLGLEFSVGSSPIFPLADVPTNSAESCSSGQSHVNICCQYNRLILLTCGREGRGRSWATVPWYIVGCGEPWGSTWKAHCCPSHEKANWTSLSETCTC